MVPSAKALAAMPNHLRLMFRTNMVEGKNPNTVSFSLAGI